MRLPVRLLGEPGTLFEGKLIKGTNEAEIPVPVRSEATGILTGPYIPVVAHTGQYCNNEYSADNGKPSRGRAEVHLCAMRPCRVHVPVPGNQPSRACLRG